jgi:replicative DNA helicase
MPEEAAGRVPPQSIEAEQSVLGACLLDRDALVRCLETLVPEDFYREAHRRIFQSLGALAERGEAADVITVAEHLRNGGQIDGVGGVAYLAELANSVPTTANAIYYAQIVAEKALLRRLLSAAAEISASVYDASEEPETLVDRAENLIFRIAQERRGQRSYVELKDLLVPAFDQISFLYEHKGEVLGVPSGLEKLDKLTTGFHASELCILAARPSQGKTTLALNIAAEAAKRGVGVGFFSLEMAAEQLAMRLLCAEAGVASDKMRGGFLDDNKDWNRLAAALDRLSKAPVYIDDTPNISMMELRARARRMKAEHDIGLLIVDYLQLMHTRGRAESRQQEIAEISRSLKALAREVAIPILALSQLSRAVEQRDNRRPQLSDLRESGAIEQDADLVMFIYQNPEVLKDPNRAYEMELIVAKQRNGPTGSVPVAFLRQMARFKDLAREVG